MSSFDSRARDWDKDKAHIERSLAIATELEKMISINPAMRAMEYGAGTGILSFLLKGKLSEITLMDNSTEMIKVCKEKVEYFKAYHIKPICYDLVHHDYPEKFDIIYNQMVLHHVEEVEPMLDKFYKLLNSGGYLAIADLYKEDGSFHGIDVKVHRGFDPDYLIEILKKAGFKKAVYRTCFEVKREPSKVFPVFLLVAEK
jgi:ubiquinone/menaquinone biosynthesis C-methylase UbiE